MSNYHEPVELLDEQTRNISRALNSLKEEIEAVDWYNQRVAATQDPQRKAIMAHNRDEEIEHACMGLEWLRRNMAGWDEELRTYLFSEGDATGLEDASKNGESRESSSREQGALHRRMMMNMLKRELAPIAQEAWNEIDERAVEVLKTHLSARRAVKVKGP